MSKLIISLQQDAINKDIPVSDLLRKALVAATKLDNQEFLKWIDKELNGYTEEPIPKYRSLTGELKASNPTRGMVPIIFEKDEIREKLSIRDIGQPISELESLINNPNESSTLVSQLPPKVISKTSRAYGAVPYLVISTAQVVGVIDVVRNIILEWSLKLEKEGVLGEDLVFSEEEKKAASSQTFNINNFTGVIGDVSGENLQIGNYNQIHSKLKELGVPQNERMEIENILDELSTSDDKQKNSLLKRAGEWLKRNASTIGTLSNTIKSWIESF